MMNTANILLLQATYSIDQNRYSIHDKASSLRDYHSFWGPTTTSRVPAWQDESGFLIMYTTSRGTGTQRLQILNKREFCYKVSLLAHYQSYVPSPTFGSRLCRVVLLAGFLCTLLFRSLSWSSRLEPRRSSLQRIFKV
jgi:hypothetical protein